MQFAQQITIKGANDMHITLNALLIFFGLITANYCMAITIVNKNTESIAYTIYADATAAICAQGEIDGR